MADLSTEKDRSRAYGWMTSAQFGGLVAGPVLAWPLYSLGGGSGKWAFYTIFLFGSALSFLTAVALAVVVREPEHARAAGRSRSKHPPYRRAHHPAHPRVPDRRRHRPPGHGRVRGAVEPLAARTWARRSASSGSPGSRSPCPCCCRSWAAIWPTATTAGPSCSPAIAVAAVRLDLLRHQPQPDALPRRERDRGPGLRLVVSGQAGLPGAGGAAALAGERAGTGADLHAGGRPRRAPWSRRCSTSTSPGTSSASRGGCRSSGWSSPAPILYREWKRLKAGGQTADRNC